MQTKTIAVLIALVGALSANAQSANDVTISATDAKSLVVGRNINVVLLPTSKPEGLSISHSAMENLHVRTNRQTLDIDAPRAEGLTVYVKVGKLTSLTLHEGAKVKTQGLLLSNRLHVYAEDGAEARLRTVGKISASALGDNDVQVTTVESANTLRASR